MRYQEEAWVGELKVTAKRATEDLNVLRSQLMKRAQKTRTRSVAFFN